MRGTIDELDSPRPIGETMPALYLDDLYTQGICEALDHVLAPVFLVLDSFPAYLDPATAPQDSLGWLAGWLGLTLEGHETAERKRELIRAGAEVLRWRGTAAGVRDAVAAVFGIVPEIVESGGVSWSVEPNSEAPSGVDARPGVTVRLRVDDPDSFDLRRFDAVVAQVKPAHISHRVEVDTRPS